MRINLVLSLVVGLAISGIAQQRDAPASAGTGTAEISGKVIDAQTGRPLGRVRVALQRANFSGGRVTSTDADGRFVFPQLAGGSYEIEASLDAYLPVKFGQRKLHGAGAPVLIVDRQKIADLTIALTRGSVVTGVVMDWLGRPLVRATVQAQRWQYTPDGPMLDKAESDTTDDRGQYRIFGLEPGDYVVFVHPTRVESRMDAEAIRNGVSDTFFPGASSAREATTVHLMPGEERAGLDVVVPLTPLATLSGSVTMIGGPALGEGGVRLIAETDAPVWSNQPQRASIAAGRFVFSGVPPGTYALTAISTLAPSNGILPGSLLFGVSRVSVAGRDVTDISLVLQHGVSVSGRLRLSPGSTAPPPSGSISLEPLVSSTALGSTQFVVSQTDAQARFTLTDVPPGPFRFRCTPCDPPWVLQSISYERRELIDLPFDVGTENIADVELVFSNTPAQISGTIADASGRPLADATVMLFPADKKMWTPGATGIRSVQSAADGRYQFRRSRAGDFLIVAADDVEPNQWFDPRFLERIADKATRVKLSLGDTQTIDLRVVR